MDEPAQNGQVNALKRGEDEAEERSWVDPRTGMEWRVRAIRGKGLADPAGTPVTLVFGGRGGRHWVGYCGEKELGGMDDTDLILLFDSTVAAAS